MVLNKKPLEKNRNILTRKGKKIAAPSVAECWVHQEDFSAARPSPPLSAYQSPRPERPNDEGLLPPGPPCADRLLPTELSSDRGSCRDRPRVSGGEKNCDKEGNSGGEGGNNGGVDSISMESMVRKVIVKNPDISSL
jgi:hypothetical protein